MKRLFYFLGILSIGLALSLNIDCAEPIFYPIEPDFAINDFSFSEDGSRIITSNTGYRISPVTPPLGSSGGVDFWDAKSGELLDQFGISIDPIEGYLIYGSNAQDISSNGERLLTGSPFDYVYLWDLTTKTFIRRFGPHPYDFWDSTFRSVQYVKLSLNGEWLLTASYGGREQIHLWNSDREDVVNIFNSKSLAFDFSPDMKYIVNGSLVYDLETLDVVYVLNSGFNPEQNAWQMQHLSNNARQIAFSNHGRFLYTSEYGFLIETDNKSQILQWDLESGEFIDVITQYSEFSEFDITEDGSLLAVSILDYSSSSFQIDLWDVEKKMRLKQIDTEQSYNNKVEFSPDGSQLLTSGPNWSVRVWNVDKLLSKSDVSYYNQYE